MSKARSPRMVCSITVGTSTVMAPPRCANVGLHIVDRAKMCLHNRAREERHMGAGGDDTSRISMTRSVELEAEVDQVWEAVTAPERLSGWLEGEVAVDVRPGGDG